MLKVYLIYGHPKFLYRTSHIESCAAMNLARQWLPHRGTVLLTDVVIKSRTMKKERKAAKEKEPFKPQDTPKPPQALEPNNRKQPDDGDRENISKSNAPGSRKHLLNEEADIDDETTI
jgi:hypothetical protein